MKTINTYTDRITPYHANKPKFVASVGTNVAPAVYLQSFLLSLPAYFDLDYAAGAQLDVVGEWIGVSRYLPEPVANYYFAFDLPNVGLDQGYWKGPYSDATTIVGLDDDTYRRLLKARILANNQDGLTLTKQDILQSFFQTSGTHVWVQDETIATYDELAFAFDDPKRGLDAAVWYQPGVASQSTTISGMSTTICVAGKIPSIVDLEILAQGLLPVATAGFDTRIAVTSVDGAPLFGFDLNNEYVGGFDVGAISVTPDHLAGELAGEFN